EDEPQEMAARVDRETPRRASELLVTLEVGMDQRRRGQCGMQVDGHSELGGLGPHRPILASIQELALLVAMDHRALEAELLDATLELVSGRLGLCRWQRGEGGEALRMLLDRLVHALVRVLRHRNR